MGEKMTTCKACGKEVAKGAKACPSCGKDTRNFFMKHKIISVVLILFIIGVVGGALGGGGDSDTAATNDGSAADNSASQEPAAEPKATPIIVTVDDLITALDSNALNATNTYKGKYVELTGKLSNIDSDGAYFSLSPLYEEYSFDTIMCKISDEHLNAVASFTDGQQVTVTGTITDIGEVLGYTLKVESIK